MNDTLSLLKELWWNDPQGGLAVLLTGVFSILGIIGWLLEDESQKRGPHWRDDERSPFESLWHRDKHDWHD